MQEKEWVSAKHVMERLEISSTTLWRYIRDKDLNFPSPVIRKRRRFFSKAELERWDSNGFKGDA